MRSFFATLPPQPLSANKASTITFLLHQSPLILIPDILLPRLPFCDDVPLNLPCSIA